MIVVFGESDSGVLARLVQFGRAATGPTSPYVFYALSSETKPANPVDNWVLIELDTDKRFAGLGGAWVERTNPAFMGSAQTVPANQIAAHSVNGSQHTFPGGTTTFLRADGTFAAPVGGVDLWTYAVLAADFTTSSATAVDITGLAFTPSALLRYEFSGILYTRTATGTVGPRPGLAWPTGMTDGVATLLQTSAANTQVMVRGNHNAALLCPVGGLPNTTQSFPAEINGSALAGALPSGNVRLQLASETAGTVVTAKAGSFLRWRTY